MTDEQLPFGLKRPVMVEELPPCSSTVATHGDEPDRSLLAADAAFDSIVIDYTIGLLGLPEIGEKYKLPAGVLDKLIKSRAFQDAVDTCRERYNDKTVSGVRKKAEALTNMILPTVYQRLVDGDDLPSGFAQVLKELRTIAGITDKSSGNTQVNIARFHLGAGITNPSGESKPAKTIDIPAIKEVL